MTLFILFFLFGKKMTNLSNTLNISLVFDWLFEIILMVNGDLNFERINNSNN